MSNKAHHRITDQLRERRFMTILTSTKNLSALSGQWSVCFTFCKKMKLPSKILLILFVLTQLGFSDDSQTQERVKKFIKSTGSYDVLNKEANGDTLAKEVITGHRNKFFRVQFDNSQFFDYILKEAPEKIRILYAIQLSHENMVSAPPSSSYIFESYNHYALLLLERRLAEINKAEQAGAGQPATRTESVTEGGDKPHPKSKGRSR
ncbi:MAG: hypothetical protein ACI9FG_001697 [Crocinitomicaceae bacterium]|jgi:hypothetical protein